MIRFGLGPFRYLSNGNGPIQAIGPVVSGDPRDIAARALVMGGVTTEVVAFVTVAMVTNMKRKGQI